MAAVPIYGKTNRNQNHRADKADNLPAAYGAPSFINSLNRSDHKPTLSGLGKFGVNVGK